MNLDIHMIVILSELIYIGPHNVTMSYAKALKNYVEITNQVNDWTENKTRINYVSMCNHSGCSITVNDA